ncbi:hypothetical protein BGX38DRAFT_1206943 [Terfezia claveryi]|nr:hypothetical protein BGX38DRAFT_1206943 [Terfezia claveryi]
MLFARTEVIWTVDFRPNGVVKSQPGSCTRSEIVTTWHLATTLIGQFNGGVISSSSSSSSNQTKSSGFLVSGLGTWFIAHTYTTHNTRHNPTHNTTSSYMANTSTGNTPRPWMREEVERLIGWMEENQELLRGKQVVWHKDITVKRISEKMGNIKKAWKDAKAMQARSGWGIKSEENEESINEILEWRCPFFWRLEGL